MCGVADSSVAALAKQSVISPLPSQGKLSNFCCILYYKTRGRRGHGRGEDDALMEAGDRPYETLTFMG